MQINILRRILESKWGQRLASELRSTGVLHPLKSRAIAATKFSTLRSGPANAYSKDASNSESSGLNGESLISMSKGRGGFKDTVAVKNTNHSTQSHQQGNQKNSEQGILIAGGGMLTVAAILRNGSEAVQTVETNPAPEPIQVPMIPLDKPGRIHGSAPHQFDHIRGRDPIRKATTTAKSVSSTDNSTSSTTQVKPIHPAKPVNPADVQFDLALFTSTCTDHNSSIFANKKVYNGTHSVTYPNNKKLSGEFRKGKLYNGEGYMLLKNGSSFEGTWKKGNWEGQGTLTYSNGKSLTGVFLNGEVWQATGTGTLPSLLDTSSANVITDEADVNDMDINMVLSEQAASIMGLLPDSTTSSTMTASDDLISVRDAGFDSTVVSTNSIATTSISADTNTTKSVSPTSNSTSNSANDNTHSDTAPATIIFSNGSIYEGEYINNKKHGQGKLTYPSGASHSGAFINNKLCTGEGTVELKDGYTYTGSVVEGKWHGEGKLSNTKTGYTVVGEFRNGKIYNGASITGVIGGCIFTRTCVQGVYSKDGTLTLANGTTFQGELRKGKFFENTNKSLVAKANNHSSSSTLAEPSTASTTTPNEYTIKLPNGATYTGQLSDKKPHGTGIITNADGTTLQGTWVEGKWCGEGKLTSASGNIMQGVFRDGKLYNGGGTYILGDKSVYNGTWLDGYWANGTLTDSLGNSVTGEFKDQRLYNGSGVRVLPDKNIFEGSIRCIMGKQVKARSFPPFILRPVAKSVLIITEVKTMPDGSKYTGEIVNSKRWGDGDSWDEKGHYKGRWVNNVKCGLGVFKFANGCVYGGLFFNDVPHGHGKMTLRDGKVFEGDFVNGALPRKPRYHPSVSESKSSSCVYEGRSTATNELSELNPSAEKVLDETFVEKVLLGKPSIHIFPWGRYEGSLLYHLPHGPGKKVYTNGELLEGNFCNGKATGHVKYVDRHGTIREGVFEDDRFISGRITYKNGLVKEGTFIDDKLSGEGKLYRQNGHSFVGQFIDGVAHGKGKTTLPNRAVCDGPFVNGKPHGRFREAIPGGHEIEFECIDGELQQQVTLRAHEGSVAMGSIVPTCIPQCLKEYTLPGDADLKSYEIDYNIHGAFRIIHPNGNVEAGTVKCNLMYAVAVMGSACNSGPKTKSDKFVVLNVAHCEPRLPKVDVTLPQHDHIIIEEVIMADGSKYVGVLQDGQRSGEGESWNKRGHFKGTWVNNVKCGKGVFTFSNGCTYEGQFANDLPNGQGKIILLDGKVFEGEFVNGALKGQPRSLTFSWGRYEGDVLNNHPHGYGRKIYKNGELMEGDFCEGVASGHVKYNDADGEVWEGHFENNQLISGKVTLKNGKVYEGTFLDWKLNGEGRYLYPDGSCFVSLFINGEPHGPAHYTDADGSVVDGTYVNGTRSGLFRAIDVNGNVVDIMYVRGEPHEVRTCELPDGTIYEVIKTEYGLNGPAKLTYPDGTVKEGLMKCSEWYGEWKTTHPDGSITVRDYTPQLWDKVELHAKEMCLYCWCKVKAAINIGQPE
eukprot:gene8920-10538_t